jgi:FkbM family methyltransferase
LIEAAGILWPDGDVEAHMVMPRMLAVALPTVLSFAARRGLALQAGGNAGLYPLALAEHFDEVITFEPERENFDCLVHNVGSRQNIRAYCTALGAVNGSVGISKIAGNSGTPRICGPGNIPMIRIDDLALSRCDLMWLAVNGYQLNALMGAASTIETCRPTIVIAERHDDDGGARLWLAGKRYREAAVVPLRDSVMVPA